MIEIVFVYRVDLSEKNEKIVAYWSFPFPFLLLSSLSFIFFLFLFLVSFAAFFLCLSFKYANSILVCVYLIESE